MVDAEKVEILLVEDSAADAEMTLRVLRKHNLANSVHHAKDGAEALDFLFGQGVYARRSASNPKVVLLDLKLPKVDGLEVLRRIRSDERLRTIPVVVLTSSQQESDIIETYALGINSYVVKPVEFEKFVDAVASLGMYWLLLNHPPVS